jgi:hypothetical protein
MRKVLFLAHLERKAYNPSMARHEISDTPLHSSERIISFFHPKCRTDPRGTLLVSLRPENLDGQLVCHVCRSRSIPMPAEATDKTRYVCQECSPLGVVFGGGLDRCGFDEMRLLPQMAREEMENDDQAIIQYFERRLNDVVSTPSALIVRHRQAGHVWAVNSTRIRVMTLPTRQRIAFVAYYWAGLSAPEIADAMKIRGDSVNSLIMAARNKLGEDPIDTP